jgi:hypothetical protein
LQNIPLFTVYKAVQSLRHSKNSKPNIPIYFYINFVYIQTIKLNIDLNVDQLIEDAKQLSPKDRLKLNDTIWNEDVAIPVEHQKIVLDRMAKAKSDPEQLLNWEEVSKTL